MKSLTIVFPWVSNHESATLRMIAEAKEDPSVDAIALGGRPPFDGDSQPSELETAFKDLVGSRKWKKLTFRCGNGYLITQFMTRIMIHGEFESIEIFDNGHSIGGWLGIRVWDDRSFDCMVEYCIARRRNLKTFRMIFSRLTDSQVRLLCNALSLNNSLEEVYFSRCEFPTPDAAGMIAGSLLVQDNVRSLTVEGAALPDEELEKFLRAIRELTHLEHLNIRGNCSVHREGGGTRGMNALADLLGQNTLKSLELSVTLMREEAAHSLANAIGQNTSLVSLAMNGSTAEFTSGMRRHQARDAERAVKNKIGLDDESLMVLLPSVFRDDHKQWKSLDLKTNRLSEAGVRLLLDRLPASAPCLEALYLREGAYGAGGEEKILEFIGRDCFELKQVEMDGTYGKTGQKKGDRIAYYLRLNHGGRRLWKTKKNVPLGLWSQVLARVNGTPWKVAEQADVIYHFLQGPVLFNHSNLPKAGTNIA